MEILSSLKRFFLGKLSIKITFSFVILSIGMALITTFIFYNISVNALTLEIKNNLENAAQSRANHIVTYFDQNIEKIKLITSRTQLRKDIENYLANSSAGVRAEIVRKLNDSKGSIEEIENICFIDTAGIVEACSDGSLAGEDYSKEEFFIKGLKVEGAYFFKHESHEDIIVSAPIYQNEKLMGAIITFEDFEELGAIVKDRTGLGETGEVLVAFRDKNGNYVYPIPRKFDTSLNKGVIGEPMKNALEGKSVFFENVFDYRNEPVIAATRYISEVKLGVVAKIDRKEVILPIQYRFLRISGFIIFVIFISVWLAGYIISKKITKPILELTSATELLRKQNFKIRVNIESEDELKELGDSFNKTAEILENLDKEKQQIDKAKTEFLSITSHELRSPMTPMKAQLQMILGDYFGKLNKEQRESLQIVLNNTERLDKIIVDFLEISRIEAARLKFNFIRADLAKTVELVVEEMNNFMPEKKIKIEVKTEKLPVIECDPDRVSQVLRNLISNAIKFSPENSQIDVSAKLHSGMILFSVKDKGVGIAEKDQRKLFEPFYQVENMYQHKSGGTGLGLAISKGIVESQNGKIWLISALGKGTIFYFTLPLKPIREIKAIKLLFSESESMDNNLKNLFKDYIGPLGEKEFEELKISTGINADSIKEYLLRLVHLGILKKETGEEFKNKVMLVLGKGEKGEKENNELSESPEKRFVSAFENN